MAGQNRANRSERGGQQGQGVPDVEFDLISLIYHNLEGVQASGRYASDAVEAGENDLAQLFQQAQQTYLEQADRARAALRQRIGGAR